MRRWWHYVLSWRFLLCAGIVKAVGSRVYVWNLSMHFKTEEKKCTQNPKQTKNNPHTLAFAAFHQWTVSSSDRNPANEFWNQNQYCCVFCLNLLIVCHGFVWTPVWWWDCKNDSPLPYWEVPANFMTLLKCHKRYCLISFCSDLHFSYSLQLWSQLEISLNFYWVAFNTKCGSPSLSQTWHFTDDMKCLLAVIIMSQNEKQGVLWTWCKITTWSRKRLIDCLGWYEICNLLLSSWPVILRFHACFQTLRWLASSSS